LTGKDGPWGGGRPKGVLALEDDWTVARCVVRGNVDAGIEGKGWGAEMKVGGW